MKVIGWLERGGARTDWLLIALFVLLRAAAILLDVVPTSDADWYYHRAVGVAAGQGYSEGGVPTAYWPPGWPLTMAALFWLLSPSVMVAKCFNLLCAGLAAWLTLDLARRLFDSRLVGRASVLLLALYPNSIGYVPLLLTETYYTTLLLAGCWVLVVSRRPAALVAAGLVFGLASLVKAQTVVAVFFLFCLFALGDRSLRGVVRSGVQMVAVLCVTVAVVAPWSLRNLEVFGKPVFISTNGGLTLLTGNNPSARGGFTPEDPLVTSIPRSVANQIEVDAEAKRRGVEWIRENPGRFVALVPLKVFRLWGPDGESEWGYQGGFAGYERYQALFRGLRLANQAYYVALIAAFLWGTVLLVRRVAAGTAGALTLLPLALCLYPTLIAMVFSGQSRFHAPIMPFVIMAAAWVLAGRPREAAGAVRVAQPA